MFVCSRLAGAQGREWNAQGTKGRDGKRENEPNGEKRKSKKVMMKESRVPKIRRYGKGEEDGQNKVKIKIVLMSSRCGLKDEFEFGV